MPYSAEERERVIRNSYEFYNITNETIQERVEEFISTFPWSEDHSNIVFVYIRTLTDYKVLSELEGTNDIRLRNSLVSSIDKLHKQLFSYKDTPEAGKGTGDEEVNELFGRRRTG